MQGIQPLYTPYHALAGFNQQYVQGILHQPSQSPAYSTPAPQYTSYQPSQDSANTAPVLQLVNYQPISSYSDQYSSYQPTMGSNVNLAQHFTNSSGVDGNSVFVMNGENWSKYDLENLGSPSRSTYVRSPPRVT